MLIPKPSELIAKRLDKAPAWVQSLTANALAISQWVGLPAALISFFADRKWVVDVGLWLYQNAGDAKTLIATVGNAMNSVAHAWRAFYAPFDALLGQLFQFHFRPWVYDAIAIVSLLFAGKIRQKIDYHRRISKASDAILHAISQENDPALIEHIQDAFHFVRGRPTVSPHVQAPPEFEDLLVEVKKNLSKFPRRDGAVFLDWDRDPTETLQYWNTVTGPLHDYANMLQNKSQRASQRLQAIYISVAFVCIFSVLFEAYKSSGIF